MTTDDYARLVRGIKLYRNRMTKLVNWRARQDLNLRPTA